MILFFQIPSPLGWCVYATRTLELAWKQVKTNAGGRGVDETTIARYEKDCLKRLLDVKERLVQSRYQPKPVKRVWIPKAGSFVASLGL